MTAPPPLPRPLRPFVDYAGFLRGFGFAIAPEQTQAFIAAVGLLGPRRMGDIRAAAFATLAPPPECHAEFEALFRVFFYEEATGSRSTPDSGETRIKDARAGALERRAAEKFNEGGAAATSTEVLGTRSLTGPASDDLRRLARQLPRCLPRRRAFRWKRARTGVAIDLRRSLRAALRHDGDVPRPALRRRSSKARNILLLIDVSGSMKAHTRDYLQVAHVLTRAAERVETFTFGTRLTRITRALALSQRERALHEAALGVEDWDGGTRIGEALMAFLDVPRFAAHARGALAIVLSDGLERDDPGLMLEAVRRLARLAWRLAWLTPLAADPRFRPETAALKAILPWLDDLGDAGSPQSITKYIFGLGRDEGRWSPSRFAEAKGRGRT
jgi:uncharacterized protein with von Willebrand factor type A (vWA) domain